MSFKQLIGQGLVKSGNRVVADVAGTLRYREPAYYWVGILCIQK